MKAEPLGIYVHVPFCVRKCPYCDFYSVVGEEAAMDAYTDTLCKELCAAPEGTADSLYFGGGTPVLLGAKRLIRLLQTVQEKFQLQGEITLEANPNAVNKQLLEQLCSAGFNRISFGMQSANAAELQALGRQHTAEQVRAAVLDAKAAGFDDISVDLMMGTPHQTVETLCQSISFLTALPLTHISAYLLKIEPGTAFHSQAVLDLLPDEDVVSDAYLAAVEWLEAAGFLQYEISNFAKPGRESKHNLKYWKRQPYLGFGPAASGFFDGKRYTHPRDLAKYLETGGQTAVLEEDRVDPLEEALLLGLRLTEGLSLQTLEQFGADLQQIKRLTKKYEQYGLLRQKEGYIQLTPSGFLVSNSILADFLAVLTL